MAVRMMADFGFEYAGPLVGWLLLKAASFRDGSNGCFLEDPINRYILGSNGTHTTRRVAKIRR